MKEAGSVQFIFTAGYLKVPNPIPEYLVKAKDLIDFIKMIFQ